MSQPDPLLDVFVEPCPECHEGKHGNCSGRAWDIITRDAETTCPCWARRHQ